MAAVSRGRVEQTVTNSRAGTVKARRAGEALAARTAAGSSRSPSARASACKARRRAAAARPERAGRPQLDSGPARAPGRRRPQRQQACLAAERLAASASATACEARRRGHRLGRRPRSGADSAAATAAPACEAARAGVEKRGPASTRGRGSQLDYWCSARPSTASSPSSRSRSASGRTPSPPGMPMPPVIDVIDTSSIYVSAPMDEVDSARHPARRSPARVAIDSHPGRGFPATSCASAPYVLDVEEQNRTVEIEVELDDAALAATLLPGTSADVEVHPRDARERAARPHRGPARGRAGPGWTATAARRAEGPDRPQELGLDGDRSRGSRRATASSPRSIGRRSRRGQGQTARAAVESGAP